VLAGLLCCNKKAWKTWSRIMYSEETVMASELSRKYLMLNTILTIVAITIINTKVKIIPETI